MYACKPLFTGIPALFFSQIDFFIFLNFYPMKFQFSFCRILFILSLGLFTSSDVIAQTWVELNAPSTNGAAVDMAVGNNGTVFVLHKTTTQNQYRLYKSSGNGIWSPVGNPITTNVQGISLALGSDETPYLAYISQQYEGYSGYVFTIRVVKFNGIDFIPIGDPIPYTSQISYYYTTIPAFSIAVYNSTPFVSFRDEKKEGKLSAKKYNGIEWINLGKDGFSEDPIDFTSIKIGSNGLPVVLYHTATDTGNIIAKKYNGAYWENIGTNGTFARNKFVNNLSFSSDSFNPWLLYVSQNAPFKFVLDGNNNPYVLLYGQFTGNQQNSIYQPQLCWFESGSWSSIPTFSTTNSAYFFSNSSSDSLLIRQFDDIVFSDGNPWIVSTYLNGNNYEARVKRKNGTNWTDMGLLEQNPDEYVAYFLGKDMNGGVYYVHSPYSNKKYCSPVLGAPSAISGATSVQCNQTPTVYTASAVAGATRYVWTLPNGWTGNSTTNTITVTPGTNSGTIAVSAINGCGIGAPKTLTVTVIGEPIKPAAIIGSSSIACNGTASYSVSSDYSVFTDAFNRGAAVQPLNNGGTPSMAYTTTTTSTGSASSTGATSRASLQSGADYALQILSGNTGATPTAQTAGATFVTGLLSNYNSLFKSTLNTNVSPVTWTFNLKTNRTTALSGFAASNYASAVVLAGTNSALHNTGNGYAVILIKGTTTNTIKLVKYTNGLGGTQTVLAAPSTDFLTNNTNWASVKVVYNPTNHQWRLFLRSDGTTANADFSGLTTQTGSTIADSAYTKTATSVFGFFFNHSATSSPTSNTALFDNFNVSVSPAYAYQWTIPNLWSGSSTTSSINVTAGATTGIISVKSINSCGASEPQTLNVSVTGTTRFNFWERGTFGNNLSTLCPNQPLMISIDTAQGSLPAAYNWIVPSGWSGSSDSSKITVTNNGSDGYVGIYFTRGCSISDTAFYNIDYESIPGRIDSIYGDGQVCPSSDFIYRVEQPLGATSYQWTLPEGWSGTSTADTIVVTPGNNSGNITVAALNSCGIPSASLSRFIQVGGEMTASIASNKGNQICSTDQNLIFSAFTNAAETPSENTFTTDNSISYLWKKNGVVIENNYYDKNKFFAGYYNLLQDYDTITCTITSTKTCLTNNPATSNPIVMFVYPNRQHVVLHNGQDVTYATSNEGSCLGNTTFVVSDADLTQSITWYKNEFDTIVSLTTHDLVNNPSRKIIAGNANSMSGSDSVGLWQPAGIYLMPDKTIYVADKANNRIQKWTNNALKGITVAGGHGYGNIYNNEDSTLTEPNDVTVVGNTIYVSGRHKIQKWVEGSYQGTTIATASDFNSFEGFSGIAYKDGYVYSTIPDKHVVMRWNVNGNNPVGEMVAGLLGDAGNDPLHLTYPNNVFLSSDSELYIADRGNYRVQMLFLSTISNPYIPSASETVAGGNGFGNTLSQLQDINDIYVDANKNIYISDKGWNSASRIIKWKNGANSGDYYDYSPATNNYLSQDIGNGSSLAYQNINSVVIDGSSTYFSYSNAVQRVTATGGVFVPSSPGIYNAQINDQYGCRVTESAFVMVKDTVARVQAALEYGGSSTDPSVLCQGRYASFYAIPYNGGDYPSYQWYKNGQAIPFANSNYFFAELATNLNSSNPGTINNGDSIYCKMISDEDCVIQTEVTSNIIKINLTASSTQTIDSVVCDQIPFEYIYNGSVYLTTDSAGTYTVAIPNASGCDSIITFNLTFAATKSMVKDTISYTQLPYTWNDTTITIDNANYYYGFYSSFNPFADYLPNIYTYNTNNAEGCDSLVTLKLYIVPPYRNYENANTCFSQLPYTWKGLTIDTSNTPYGTSTIDNIIIQNGYRKMKQFNFTKNKNYLSSIGIDSIITLSLTAKAYDSTFLNLSASGSYTLPWGNTVTSSGTYTYSYNSIYGCDSIVTIQLTITAPQYAKLTLKTYLEGYYIGNGLMSATLFDLGRSSISTATDSIQVNLWNSGNVGITSANYTASGVLLTNGSTTLLFPGAIIGGAYYISVKHRNSLETWSAYPVNFSTDSTSYDFTTDLNKAFSDNVNPPMKSLSDGKYALYGGDVNQDGTVDGGDMNEVDNNSSAAAFGYDNSDTNGDGATDGLDMNIIDNNTQLGLFFARPF